MKKYLNFALAFALYGLCSGVFFREFTKFNGFTDRTMLGMAHPHILMLGMGGCLLAAIFVKLLGIEENKKLKIANIIYFSGLLLTSATMICRGTMEVVGLDITKTVSAIISGVAGIGHIAVAAGIIRFINVFRKAEKQ